MAAPTIREIAALTSGGTSATVSIAVTLPASRTVGDLLLIDVSTIKTLAGTITVAASGWTLKHERINSTSGKHWLWRICDGTEAGTVTVTASGSNPSSTRWKARAIAITTGTFDAASPFDSSSGAGTSSGASQSTFTGGSFTPSVADCLAIASLTQSSATVVTTTPDSPATELYDNAVLNHLVSIHGHSATPAGGVSTAITGTWAGGTVQYTALTVVVKPYTPPPPAPVADFTGTPLSGVAPLAVVFTDASTNTPTAWDWNFGDGTTHGTTQNPSHNYTVPGTYTVVLTATNAGGSDSETKTAYVTVTAPPTPPVAEFSATPLSGDAPLSVTFTDLSTNTPSAWSWDFTNDGTPDSTLQNPSHVYSTPGTYAVKLTATNTDGSDSETKLAYITVTTPPLVAEFSGGPLSGVAPLTVNFTDLSTGTPTSWEWDFQNDGLPDSFVQNPSHVYPLAGTYSVKLRVGRTGSSDTETKTAYVTVTADPGTDPPVAAFSADPVTGPAPLEVSFTDLSTGDPVTWTWDFGDGSPVVHLQNPLHEYAANGVYTVTLTVANAGGSDSDTQSGAVTAGDTPSDSEVEGVAVAFDDAMLVASPAWTRLDSTPNLVAEYSIRRGRQDEFEKTGTGTATIRLNDTAGLFDPTNTGSPFYTKLDGRQAGIALWNPVTGTWHTIFRGFIDEYAYALHPAGVVTTVEMELVDGMDYLAGVEIAPGTAGDDPSTAVPPFELAENEVYFIGGEVDDRIIQLLQNAGWPTDLRTIFSGNVYVKEQVASAGTSILSLLQDAADAEFPGVANIYVSRDGKVTFHGRHARFDPIGTASSTTEWDFTRWKAGDGSVTGTDASYAQLRGLGFARQRKMIVNAALAYPYRNPDTEPELTTAEMEAQLVTSPSSIAAYGVHSWSAENLMTHRHKTNGNDDLEETKLMALHYVQNYAQPQNRLTQLVFRSLRPDDPRAAATWALICGVEVSDTVRVKTAHAGPGGFNDQEFYVEGLSYEVRPLNAEYADVTLSLDVSPIAYYANDPFDDT